jgi:hypothetical protein
MRHRATFWLAWVLAGISFATFMASLIYAFLALGVADPAKQFSRGSIGELLAYLPFLAFPIVGVLIASKRPGNPIGWICLVSGLFWMAFALGDASDAYELARTGTETHSVTMDALLQASWVPPVGLLGIYMILLFPDGRLPSRRWRPFSFLAGTVMVLILIFFVLAPGPLEGHPGVRNPFGLEAYPWLDGVSLFFVLLLPLCILTSAFSLALRYRRSGTEVREQIKWLVFTASFVGVMYLGVVIVSLYFESEFPPLLLSLIQHVGLVTFAGIPIAIGIAILKYRLYDIDIIINRALVYGPLTAVLILAYLGIVVSSQYVIRMLTGQESQLAVVASTLAIAALFNPLRRRIQSIIDRRFYRRKYDAARTLETFSASLRNDKDLEQLSAELLSVIRDTVQPSHVSLWLRDGRR